MRRQPDLRILWREIIEAGGINAYVNAQLEAHGYVVQRRDTDSMSKRELNDYKKRLKTEAAEKKRLRQEAWRAYKNNNIVHLGEGIYWNDADTCDKYDLPQAAERAAENELVPLHSPKELAEAMGISTADLRWLAFHRDAAAYVHYHQFSIPKRDGTPRSIWAPLPKLKQVQRWILRHIVEKLPVHSAAHGFVPLRSTATNAAVHINSRVIIKMDLEDFFPTVTFPRVKGVFRKAGYGEQIAILLAAICTEAPRQVVVHNDTTYYIALGPRSLPQGAPTSPAITNTLCLSLDRRISALARKNGWRYTRYADDLTLSFSADSRKKPGAGRITGLVKRLVADEGFKINASKTRFARPAGRQKVTGLVVNDSYAPRVPREVKRRLRAAIHNLSRGKGVKEGESLERLAGYAAYIHMSEPELGRRLLDALNQFSHGV